MRTGTFQTLNCKFLQTIHIIGISQFFPNHFLTNRDDYNVIMKHLWTKLNSKPKEWRRIFKSLHAMDYLIRNGAPRVVQDIKDELYKIRSLQDFSYNENGVDRGQGVRDKSRAICELVGDASKLQEEREFAMKTRNKFQGISNTNTSSGGSGGYSGSNPAAPASGKYGGFGSEDIHRFGYQEGKFNAPYDPYTKSQSVPTMSESDNSKSKKREDEEGKERKKSSSHKKKNKKKKKKDSDSDSEEDSSEEESSSDEDTKKKKKRASVSKAGGLQEVPKASRQIDGNTSGQPKAQQNNNTGGSLIDLLESSIPAQPNSTTNASSSGFNFMSGPAQTPQAQSTFPAQQTANLFGNLNLNQPQQQQQQQPIQQQLGGLFQPNPLSTNNAFGMQQTQQNNNAFGFLNQTQPSFPQQQQQQPSNSFGFLNPQQPQQQQQQQTSQNIFANLNLGSGSMPQQQQQPTFPQQNTNAFSSFGTAPSQPSQPMHQQQQKPQDMFAGFNMGQSSQSSQQNIGFQSQPAQQNFQQQQQQQNQNSQWGMPTNKKGDAWSDGSGLFNLSNLKSGEKSLLESQRKSSMDQQPNLLHTKEGEIDQLWSSPFKTGGQGSQGMASGNQSFAQPKPFVPSINPNTLFQINQGVPQQQQFNPGMMGTGFGSNMGFQGQQQQPLHSPSMGGQMQFQPPQFFGQGQQQQQQQSFGNQQMSNMMQRNMMGQQPGQQPMGMGNQGMMGQQQNMMGGNPMGQFGQQQPMGGAMGNNSSAGFGFMGNR